MLRAVLGLYPGYGIGVVDELRRQSYATLGALAISAAFLGLHRGQDVSRSVLIGGFLALLIAAPLARRSAKWGLQRAGLWGAGLARMAGKGQVAVSRHLNTGKPEGFEHGNGQD